MRLHYFPGTIAVAVAVTLEEAGIPYEPVLVNFKESQQSGPDYLAINPKGRVPALETEGAILTETGAILDYIAAKAPKAGLIPSDPMTAARVRAVMYYVASTVHVNHAHKMRGHRWANEQSSFDDMKAKVPETMRDCAVYIEDNCLTGPYVLGDTFSIADAYLYVCCAWMQGDGVDVSAFPSITRFIAAMEERVSLKAVRANGIQP